MSEGRTELERFLTTDPDDVGCEAALEMLHVYAELIASGHADEPRFRGISAHLEACGPCGEDFAGLIAALRDPQN